jgi:hypothetical protein
MAQNLFPDPGMRGFSIHGKMPETKMEGSMEKTTPRTFLGLASLATALLTGCVYAESSASSSSSSSAEVHIGDGAGGGACLPGDGARGGDGGTVVIRTAQAQEAWWVEDVLQRLEAQGGVGGLGGQAASADQSPGEPGPPGQGGGIALTVTDCVSDDGAIDPELIRPLSRPTDPEGVNCLFTVDPPADSTIRVGVPGETDILPTEGVLVVEEFHLGPGETLHVQGDLTVYAKRVFIEFNATLRSVAGPSFSVVDDAATNLPGLDGGDLIFIAEEIEIGGTLDVSGNDGDATEPAGQGGRAIAIATTLNGIEDVVDALPFASVKANGGKGQDGQDAAPCSSSTEASASTSNAD